MKKLITEKFVIDQILRGNKTITLDSDYLVTPLAADLLKEKKIKIVRIDKQPHKETTIAAKVWKKVAIGCDHTGFRVKNVLTDILRSKGFIVEDVGTYNENSCDYPDFAIMVSKKILLDEADFGILVDASGIPSAITANKFPGIRAATCYNEFSARSSRAHNDSNVLVVGAKALGEETIKSILEVWLNTKFEDGRHGTRLNKISEIEKQLLK